MSCELGEQQLANFAIVVATSPGRHAAPPPHALERPGAPRAAGGDAGDAIASAGVALCVATRSPTALGITNHRLTCVFLRELMKPIFFTNYVTYRPIADCCACVPCPTRSTIGQRFAGDSNPSCISRERPVLDERG